MFRLYSILYLEHTYNRFPVQKDAVDDPVLTEEVDETNSLVDKYLPLERPLSDHSITIIPETAEKPETQEEENVLKTTPENSVHEIQMLEDQDECDYHSLLDEIVFSPLAIPPLDEINFTSVISLDDSLTPPTSPKFSPRRLFESAIEDIPVTRRKSMFFAKPEQLLRPKHKSSEIIRVDNKAFKGLVRHSSRLKSKGKDFTKRIRKTFSFHQDV